MISFKNNRPLLQNGYCVFSDYDLAWLVNVLQEAADSAGTKLPFKEEIAAGVLQYLETSCPLHAVPLDYLFDRMRNLLNQIGLPLIATHLRKQTPPVSTENKKLFGAYCDEWLLFNQNKVKESTRAKYIAALEEIKNIEKNLKDEIDDLQKILDIL